MAVLVFRCQSFHIMPVAIKAFIFHPALGPITPAVYCAHGGKIEVLGPIWSTTCWAVYQDFMRNVN